MNKVDNFQKILKLRTIFKSLSQLSWNINKLEKRYPLESLDEKEIEGLGKAYIEYAKWLKKIHDELEDELGEKRVD